jgi:hypothetical protein
MTLFKDSQLFSYNSFKWITNPFAIRSGLDNARALTQIPTSGLKN